MRKLSLNKEVLTDLTTAELGAVVGGQQSLLNFCPTDPCITPPVSQLRCTFSLGPDICGS